MATMKAGKNGDQCQKKNLKQKRNKLPGKRFGPPPLRGPKPQGISN
jgi:hypothetical protein